MKTVLKLASQKTCIPALNTVVVKNNEAFACDMETAIWQHCELPDGIYDSNVIKAGLKTTSQVKESELPCFNIPRDNGIKFTLPVQELTEALSFVAQACSKEETRFYLMGVHFDNTGVEATDGHRLFQCRLNMPELTGINHIIVPVACINYFLSLVKEEKANGLCEVTLFGGVNRKGIAFQLDNARIESKLIDESFPDTERVIPKTRAKKHVYDSESLLKIINSAKALKKRDNTPIVIFSDSETELIVRKQNGKEYYTEANYSFGNVLNLPIRIGFNPELLRGLSKGMIGIAEREDAETAPITWESECGKKLAVVMPIRIPDKA